MHFECKMGIFGQIWKVLTFKISSILKPNYEIMQKNKGFNLNKFQLDPYPGKGIH